MKVEDILKIDSISLITKTTDITQEIKGLYTCDLLSWVMGKVKEEKVALLTVLNSLNAVAIGTLLDLSAIIFCEGVIPSKQIIDKAEEEGINLLTSTLNSYKTALIINGYEEKL